MIACWSLGGRRPGPEGLRVRDGARGSSGSSKNDKVLIAP